METVFNEIQHSVKNWWASLLLGIVYIIVALWLMFAPLSSYVALSIVFSISMLISGILEILFAVSNRKGVPSWGWYIVGGIIDVILGIYLIAYPMVSISLHSSGLKPNLVSSCATWICNRQLMMRPALTACLLTSASNL